MSKGLEEIRNPISCTLESGGARKYEYRAEQVLAIEKELQAFEILKSKQVDIELFMDCDKWEEYVLRCENHADMSKPVYDLLKEVLL